MDTMNALVWKGDGALSLERRPIPALQGPRDAIVRVTRSPSAPATCTYAAARYPVPGPAWCWAMSSSGWWRPWETGFPTSAPAAGWPPAARASAVSAGSAAGAMSTTASTAAGSWAAASTAVRPSTSGCPSPTPASPPSRTPSATKTPSLWGIFWPAATGARSCAPSSPATRRWCWA